MKRTIRALVWLCCLLALFAIPALAEETGDTWSQEEFYEEQMEESGAASLMDSLPPETQELLRELGIEDPDWQTLSEIEPGSFFQTMGEMFFQGLPQAAGAAAALLGIMILCAVTSGLRISFGSRQTEQAVAIVGTLSACAVIASPVLSCIQQASVLIEGAGAFLLAGVPIIAGIMLACGQPVSAGGWSVFLIAAGNAVSFLSAVVLLPVMNIFLAFSLVSAVSPQIRLDALCTAFSKCVRWVLTTVVTLFCSLLSAQSLIAASADSAASKAAKMAVGFVPVVGSALGDAVGTVQECLKLLRSGVGGFGLLAALCLFLPVIFQCIIWIFCCTLCGAAGEVLGLSEITGVLKASSQVLQTLLAILISCGVVMLVAAVLVMRGGGG